MSGWLISAASLAVFLFLVTPGQASTIRLALAQTALRLYASPEAFYAHMAERVAAAMTAQPQLILFPEDIGLPLLLLPDYEAVRGCATAAEATRLVVERHAAAIAPLVAQGLSPQRAVIKILAPQAEAIYLQTFADLARKYSVYIAAGSAPLPFYGGLAANVAVLFGPEGELIGRVAKSQLIDLEGPAGLDLWPAEKGSQAVLPTPLGRLGLIVCADAWDPQLAAAYKRQGAQLLLNCLANPEPWDAAKEREMDAGSLPARVAELGLPGAQCYGVGRLFELEFQGRSQLLLPKEGGGWHVVARAQSADKEEIIAGTLPLPAP